MSYAILYTVYCYETDENHLPVLKDYSDFIFANSVTEACRDIENEFPEAVRIDIQGFDYSR